MDRRALTPGELHVLKLIQGHYGARNTPKQIVCTSEGEATISVTANDGSIPLMANVSNLAAWRADGTIASEEELKREWLRIE